MAAILTENQVSMGAPQNGSSEQRSEYDMAVVQQLVAELGIWLASIEHFSNGVHPHPGVHGAGIKTGAITAEFRIVRSALMRSTRLAIKLLYSVQPLPPGDFAWATVAELEELVAALQDACITASSLMSGDVNSGVWHAYRRMLATALTIGNAQKFMQAADASGGKFLPRGLFDLLGNCEADHGELKVLEALLPRFGRILKWLSVVGEMLQRDEPLKPSVLLFSHIERQLTDLTTIIDEQLADSSKSESEIFAALDAASYTASVELKKVRSKELPGLLHLDPATSVHARIETAYSLLNDSLQQIVATFATALDPNASVFALFPEFEVKRQNSLELRSELWKLTQAVRAAEVHPDGDELAALNAELLPFANGAARHLFYKDTESVERFIEEISLTRGQVDMAPLLHRFGAFLETLFGQVNLRGVLQDQPFVPPDM